jgi:hypothetical protein
MVLLTWLAADAAIWSALPAGEAANEALDHRGEAETEQAWLREATAVQEALRSVSIPETTSETIEAIAEQAFVRAFGITEHHDLAAQISDDLRLLAEAGVVGYRSSTLDGLWSAYSSGRFPDHLR